MDGFSSRGENNKQLNVLGGILEPCKSILHSNKVIIDKSRGDLSLLEQDTTKNVF